MKNNLTNKFFSSFNYNTYKNIYYISCATMCTSFVANTIVEKPLIFIPLEASSLAVNLYIFLNEKKTHSAKDIEEIKTLYQDFIKNYNKLNSTFELDNPIEIYTMFNYLYKNGYLSQNKTFTFSDKNVIDITPIMGTNIFSGKGVCRHISVMLIDILNNYDINANYLTCLLNTPTLQTKIVTKENFSLEKNIDTLNIIKKISPEEYNTLYDCIICLPNYEKYINISIVPQKTKGINGILERKTGNHAICLAQKDGINYFLDPTNEDIYRLNGKVLYDKYGLPLEIKKAKVSNKELRYKTIEDIYNENSISNEEVTKLISTTQNICKTNIDIFETFYNENKEIYEEVTNKLKKIKRK